MNPQDQEQDGKDGVPRWLELQAEADYWAWVIEQMYAKAGLRSPIDRMIDHATGHTEATVNSAKHAINQFERCRKELAALTDLQRSDPPSAGDGDSKATPINPDTGGSK